MRKKAKIAHFYIEKVKFKQISLSFIVFIIIFTEITKYSDDLKK